MPGNQNDPLAENTPQTAEQKPENAFLFNGEKVQQTNEASKNSFLDIVDSHLPQKNDAGVLSEAEILGIPGTEDSTTKSPPSTGPGANHLASVSQLFAPGVELGTNGNPQAQQQDNGPESSPPPALPLAKSNPILHIAAAMVIGLFLMGITFFLGGSGYESDFQTSEDYLLPSGKTYVELLSRESFFARYQQAIFGGETITTHEGQAILQFSDGTVVRIRQESKVKIVQIEPHPIVKIEAGSIWVFGQRNPEVRFETAVFFPRAASGHFETDGGVAKASSFRHPIFGELQTASDRRAPVVIPFRHQVMFSDRQIPDTFPDLHFSKLRKELHLKEIKDTDWTLKNLVEDKKMLNDQLVSVRPRKKISLAEEGLMASFKKMATLFPGKQARNAREAKEAKRRAFLDEFVFRTNSYNLKAADAQTAIIDESLYYSNIVEPDNSLAKSVQQLREELDKRQDQPNKERVIAQNALSMLEDAFDQRNSTIAEAVLADILKKWQKEKYSDKNRIRLEMYREIITSLLKRNMSQITDSIFESASKLDLIALQWESKDKVVTTLEIVDKNLETADAFLKKGAFEIARKILEMNDVLLKINPSPRLIETQLYLTKRQEMLKTKRTIFQAEGVMTDARFQDVLKKRKEAEQTIKDIRATETAFLNGGELLPQNSGEGEEPVEQTLVEKVRRDFTQEGLVLISAPEAKQQDAEILRIEEALLPDGTMFSADYYPGSKVITNVEIPTDGIVIESEILLKNLRVGVDSMRVGGRKTESDLAAVTEQIEESWHITEEDPLEKVDPLIIDVSKRMVHATLQENGMESSLKEIGMLTEDTLRIKTTTFPELSNKDLTFIYNIKNKTVSDAVLRPDGIELEATDIPDLKQQATQAYQYIKQLEEQKNNALWVLTAAKVKLEKSDLTYSGSLIYFENGLFNEQWRLTGLADPTTERFTKIDRNGEPLFRDIGYDELKRLLINAWEAEGG